MTVVGFMVKSRIQSDYYYQVMFDGELLSRLMFEFGDGCSAGCEKVKHCSVRMTAFL